MLYGKTKQEVMAKLVAAQAALSKGPVAEKPALTLAMRWEVASRNVARLVDRPRRERTQINPFTPDEARQFLAAVRGHRLEALFSVALALGLRQGEALGLRWADIDFEANTLRV